MKNHDRGAMYLVCPDCGTDRVSGAKPQAALDAWIDENRADSGPDDGPDKGLEVPEQNEPPAEPETPASTEPPPKPGPGFFQQANAQLEQFFEG